jgi:hypothetical protein
MRPEADCPRVFGDRRETAMAVGPVQLLVLGFPHPEFHGEIIAELERLKESDTVRVIDAPAVYKDAAGDAFISPLDHVEIGLLSAEEAEQHHAVENAAAARAD